MRQLAPLAGQDPVTAGFRQEDFPGLCQAAAQACRDRGRRLVLVVDGLDEDHGAGTRSIAALLPRHPPAGMRIVVTGRPHPLVPDDVPDDHPLRLAHIVRVLVPSPHATGISRMARRELDRLLKDEQVGVPLLGLLTAARGSLTAADLADLADVRPFRVEQLLRGITGRSFVPGSHGQILLPDASADARPLALGHKELRDRALAALGDVSEFEDRLHAWADGYRTQGWPPGTPDYLLYDYPRMLYSTEDSERLTTIALDPRRQRTLLGQASLDAAFFDIELSARMIRRRHPDDLTELAALAASRAVLTEQARAVPVSVAVAFARLGHPQRAEQFALMAPHPAEKAIRLASVARALEKTGDRRSVEAAREAARWAGRARAESAPTSGDEDDAEAATAQAAVALITVGDHDQGCALLKSLRTPSPSGDVDLLAVTAAQAALAARPRDPALAEELLEQAEHHADDVPSSSPANPSTPVTAWAYVAAAAGPARAARLHARITQYAQSFPPSLAACTVDAAAASALAAEHPERAHALAQQAARRLTNALTHPEALSKEDAATLAWHMVSMLTDVTRALMDTGCADDARTLVDGVPEATYTAFGIDARARALAELTTHDLANEEEPFLEIPETLATRACRLAAQDQPEEAHRLLHRALQALGSRQSAAPGEGWLITLCSALAVIGRQSDGALLARSLRDPADRVQALAAASISAGAAGNLVEARHLAHEAADGADSLQGGLNFSLMDGAPGYKVSDAKSAAAQALAHIGERDRALALAEETGNEDSGRRRRALVAVATGLRSHDPASATATGILDRELERLMITDAPQQGPRGTIARLAELLAASGDGDQQYTDRLREAVDQTWARLKASKKRPHTEDFLVLLLLHASERRADAEDTLVAWERRCEGIPPWELPTIAIAVAHAAFGAPQAARQSAESLNVPHDRTEALAAVAGYLTGSPAVLYASNQGSSAAFTHTLHTLALLHCPPDPAHTAKAAWSFTTAALAGDGWHHALPALARLAPAAVLRTRDIVFAHRQIDTG
ncbi:hypothetical protein [Streptomyces sp. NPDC001269]